jgi:hypothetical protein
MTIKNSCFPPFMKYKVSLNAIQNPFFSWIDHVFAVMTTAAGGCTFSLLSPGKYRRVREVYHGVSWPLEKAQRNCRSRRQKWKKKRVKRNWNRSLFLATPVVCAIEKMGLVAHVPKRRQHILKLPTKSTQSALFSYDIMAHWVSIFKRRNCICSRGQDIL